MTANLGPSEWYEESICSSLLTFSCQNGKATPMFVQFPSYMRVSVSIFPLFIGHFGLGDILMNIVELHSFRLDCISINNYMSGTRV